MRGAQGQKVFMAERKIKALAQYQTRFTPDDVTQIIQSLTNREFSPNLDVQVEQLLMAIAANQALNEAQQQQLCLVAKLTNNLEAFKGRRGYATQHNRAYL